VFLCDIFLDHVGNRPIKHGRFDNRSRTQCFCYSYTCSHSYPSFTPGFESSLFPHLSTKCPGLLFLLLLGIPEIPWWVVFLATEFDVRLFSQFFLLMRVLLKWGFDFSRGVVLPSCSFSRKFEDQVMLIYTKKGGRNLRVRS